MYLTVELTAQRFGEHSENKIEQCWMALSATYRKQDWAMLDGTVSHI